MTVWHVTFLILIDSQMEILATQLLLKVQSPWERYELEIEIQDSLVVTAMGLNEVTKGLNITEEKIIKPCRVINYVKRCCIVGPSFPPSLFPPPLPPSLPPSFTHDYKSDKAAQNSAYLCPDSESNIFPFFYYPPPNMYYKPQAMFICSKSSWHKEHTLVGLEKTEAI